MSIKDLLSSLRDRPTFVGALLQRVDSQEPEKIFVGYGVRPHKVTGPEWDDESNLIELGNLADVCDSSIKLRNIPVISQDHMSSFNYASVRRQVNRLYVIYLFDIPVCRYLI